MKFASINIERSRHLQARVLPFLRQEQPDVLCLQELCEHDIPVFEDFFGQKVYYAPMCLHRLHSLTEGELVNTGVGLVSKQPLLKTAVYYYLGRAAPIPTIGTTQTEAGQSVPIADCTGQAIVSGSVGGVRFLTTHLLVTPAGTATPEQLGLAQRVIDYTKWEANQYGNTLLCGDFNAPRGRATWDLLAGNFTDNIPAHYTTSLDGILHKAGPIPYVVDGVFSQGNLKVSQVKLHNGVSDHCAVIGEIELI